VLVYAEVTASWAGYLGPDLVFCRAGRVVFWLRQGQRDGGADELEGLALLAGGLGEHRPGNDLA
jgi:hypothetical protein